MEREKRESVRLMVTFHLSVEWEEEPKGSVLSQGVSDNIGLNGLLAHLPRELPQVGQSVIVSIFEEDGKLAAQTEGTVLRLERNAAHPQVAIKLSGYSAEWEQKVWSRAQRIVNEVEPDVEDWSF